MSWTNQRMGWKPTVLVLGAVLVLAGGLLFTLPPLLETGTAHAQESGPYDYAYNSLGATVPATTWYLPLNDGQGSESWIVVHNPGASAVEFDVDLMTASGPVAGPQDQSLAAYARYTVSVDAYTSGQVCAESDGQRGCGMRLHGLREQQDQELRLCRCDRIRDELVFR